MKINLTKKELDVIVDSLRNSAAQAHMVWADPGNGYSESTRATIWENHQYLYELADNLCRQIKARDAHMKKIEDQPKKIDPFENTDWNPNDPSNW